MNLPDNESYVSAKDNVDNVPLGWHNDPMMDFRKGHSRGDIGMAVGERFEDHDVKMKDFRRSHEDGFGTRRMNIKDYGIGQAHEAF